MNIKPTESELDILNIVWDRGPSTVRDIHDEILKTKDAGYTTTLKLMQIMLDKGLLSREDAGRSHIYTAAITREATQGQLVRRMIDNVFNGSASSLVMQALGNKRPSRKEIDEIKRYLSEIEKGK